MAVDDLLDAAGQIFAEVGVARATMVEISRAAGCSRATLYRYFPNQHALHLAFVHRATSRIAAGLAALRERGDARSEDVVADRILAGVGAVRADPLLAIWFEPENIAVPLALSQDSDILASMASALIGEVDPGRHSPTEVARRGAWLLRSIVSLLAMPGANEQEERAMVESFVVPVLMGEPISGKSDR